MDSRWKAHWKRAIPISIAYLATIGTAGFFASVVRAQSMEVMKGLVLGPCTLSGIFVLWRSIYFSSLTAETSRIWFNTVSVLQCASFLSLFAGFASWEQCLLVRCLLRVAKIKFDVPDRLRSALCSRRSNARSYLEAIPRANLHCCSNERDTPR